MVKSTLQILYNKTVDDILNSGKYIPFGYVKWVMDHSVEESVEARILLKLGESRKFEMGRLSFSSGGSYMFSFTERMVEPMIWLQHSDYGESWGEGWVVTRISTQSLHVSAIIRNNSVIVDYLSEKGFTL